jgi:hypothetical protein
MLTSDSGDVYRGISAGRGKYIEIQAVWQVPKLSFTVEKNRILKTISISVHSPTLERNLYRAVLAYSHSPGPLPTDFDAILKHYDALKSFLQRLEFQSPTEIATLELRLLVRDFLLDRAVYDGIGMEDFRKRNVVCLTHLRDIHERSVDAGLDEIDDCFALGLVPDEINDDYIEALNARYSELALSGDYTGLYNLCEPIVRSGEIELHYNPEILLNLLDQGRLDIYRYLLDLVSRTKEIRGGRPGLGLPDISYDPLYVAIRLGHLDKVQTLLNDGATFEGESYEESQMLDRHHVLTPISAAVFWRKPDVVRLLLQREGSSQVGLEKAITIALSHNFEEIIKIFLDSGVLPSPKYPLPAEAIGLPIDHSEDTSTERELIPDANMDRDDIVVEGITEVPRDFGKDSSNSVPQHPGPLGAALAMQNRTLRGTSAIDDGMSTISVTSKLRHKPGASIRRKGARYQRQKIGQDLVRTLNSLCGSIRETCRQSHRATTMAHIGNQFMSVGAVWQRGMDSFRRIMRNKPPDDIVDVLDCLLVASAMCSAMYDADRSIQLQ